MKFLGFCSFGFVALVGSVVLPYVWFVGNGKIKEKGITGEILYVGFVLFLAR